MDEQTNGRIAALTFAVGKLIRDVSRTRDARQEQVQRLRDWADGQIEVARESNGDASLSPEQQAFLSGLHDTVDTLIALIDSPVYPRGQRSDTSTAPADDPPPAAP
ncbi:hypothetical protein [Achromobacter aloeverae]